jgi:hypothetical protein
MARGRSERIVQTGANTFKHRLYMCRQKKMLASWEATLAPFDRSRLHLPENPDVHPPKKNEPLSQEMHLKILHFSSGLKMSGDVEKLCFTYLWNRYHQQIPGIKLIHIGAISVLLCQHYTSFHRWKDIWCWKLPYRVATSENDCLHIYSLWNFVIRSDT